MVELLFAGLLLAWQGTGHTDAEHIDPQPRTGVSAAVIVADSVPLVHTQQISADMVQPAVRRLEAILKDAGSSLERLVKLNFIVTNDEKQEALRRELARG